MLSAVHASIKQLNAAVRGYEGVSPAVAETVAELAQGRVPRAWVAPRVELCLDNVAAWLADLQTRLEFLYDWAVGGPPPAMPLGMLSRPRAFLTAVQQSFAELGGRPVGQLHLEAVLLAEEEGEVLSKEALHTLGAAALGSVTLTCAADGARRSLGAMLAEGCLVGGLVLQGARWDRERRCLADTQPGALHCALPLVWLRATSSPSVPALARALALPGAVLPVRARDAYVCPVFKYVACFGAKHNLADDDDCLATLLMPCGNRAAEYWATHNVGAVAMADPAVQWEGVPAVAAAAAGGQGQQGGAGG